MKLIIIHGAPGVGKLTVARELSRETGYKLFHNHLTVDLVCSMFDFDSEQAIRLSDRFRLEMFEEAARAEIPGVRAGHHRRCRAARRRGPVRPADLRDG
jgi:broad-specificity NMP kinase